MRAMIDLGLPRVSVWRAIGLGTGRGPDMRTGMMMTGLAIVLLSAPAFAKPPPAGGGTTAPPVEITADQSLEYYQDKGIYVARGNAKAVRGDMTVTSDIMTAHQRPKPAAGTATPGQAAGAKPKTAGGDDPSSGDIDKMTAEGHVIITKPGTVVTGDHAVDDTDNHVMVVTGHNLKYETDKQVVTARDSLEYWDEKKIAVARGHAVAVKGDRHVEGDVLTAEFRPAPPDAPPGKTGDQLTKMTAQGNVVVITKNDVTHGDHAVYDAARDIAIISGHVRITRGDGTELTGDVGESDFAANQSRLMNDGSGRVRVLLPAHTTVPKPTPSPSSGTSGAGPTS